MTMKKIRLSEEDLCLAINGLYRARDDYLAENKEAVEDLILGLLDVCGGMKPGRTKRVPLQRWELRMIRSCLNDWRNAFLSAGEPYKAEALAESLTKFAI